MRILLLMIITMNAYSLEIIPLTNIPSEQSTRFDLSSAVGVPVHSNASAGKIKPKQTDSMLFDTAIFVIGDDEFSRNWLISHSKTLQKMQAIGFITNVDSIEIIAKLQEETQLPLLPVNIDPLMKLLHESHYPLVIARGEVWQ